MRYRTEEITRLRMQKGWTQKTLGERSGVQRAAISMIERHGYQRPDTLAKLAKALGVKLADLMEESR